MDVFQVPDVGLHEVRYEFVSRLGGMMEDPDEPQEWGLVQRFWIDTDAYSERDRLMFCCGVEFEMIRQNLKNPEFTNSTIHRENESRVRMMIGGMGRACRIEQCEPEHDPDGTWSYLEVSPDLTEGKD